MYGTLVFVNDANEDPDHDGFSNIQEYWAGTNPNDSTSLLKLSIVGFENQLTLGFFAVSNLTYSVLHKQTLNDLLWSKLVDVSAQPTNRVMSITNAPLSNGSGFFRIATPALP